MSPEAARRLGLWRLVGSEMSMFTAKVRPAFSRKGLHWVEQLATDPLWQEAEERTGNRMIPVVFTPEGECIPDSSVILDLLEERHPEIPIESPDPVVKLLGRLFEIYHDEFMPMLAIYYRWIEPRAIEEGKARAIAMTGRPDMGERGLATVGGYAPLFGIEAATIPAIEAHYRDLLDALEAHLATTPYVLGDVPSLADFSLCGAGHAHLYLDEVPHRIMWQRAPRVTHWMMRVVNADPFASGEWLDPTSPPPGFVDLLRTVGRAAGEYLADVARALAEPMAGVAVGRGMPRALGVHRTRVCGVATNRVTTPYTLFMIQRVQDVHRSLAPDDRRRAEALLDGTGWEALLEVPTPARVALVKHKLVRVESSPGATGATA